MTDGQATAASLPQDWRSYQPSSLPSVLEAALACFVEHGYHGTTIRTIARKAGLSVPGLYHHYASKHELLVAITSHAMDELWQRSMAALEEADDDVLGRFDLLVECLILFHAHRRDLAFIAASEIRSLIGQARTDHIAARDRQQRLLDETVAAAVAQGVFTTPFPREASRAVITMCTGVAQWYHHEGTLRPEDVVHEYRTVARMAVGRISPT